MKQHIVAKQLDELSERAMVKYSDCFLKKNYDSINGMALLSIGQMIEFLGNRWLDKIDPLYRNHPVYANQQTPNNDELCDALWEAVKEELEK